MVQSAAVGMYTDSNVYRKRSYSDLHLNSLFEFGDSLLWGEGGGVELVTGF